MKITDFLYRYFLSTYFELIIKINYKKALITTAYITDFKQFWKDF